MSTMQVMFSQGKPTVEVEVIDNAFLTRGEILNQSNNNDNQYMRNYDSNNANNASTQSVERREMSVQTLKETRDAATDSRSFSAERNFQNMLLSSEAAAHQQQTTDVAPVPHTFVPVSIQERPSLESSEFSEQKRNEKERRYRSTRIDSREGRQASHEYHHH